MKSLPLRIGINGLGRIGRALVRIFSRDPEVEIVAINELDSDIENFAYLLKYDSLYGRFHGRVECDAGRRVLRIGDHDVSFHSESRVCNVPWVDRGVDVLIEATGVTANVLMAPAIIATGIRKVVVTNAHPGVDATIIVGVNERQYDPGRHHVVSSSICDANAIVPILHHLDSAWGVVHGYVTTLHPWLSYQNLLDGPVSSVASPGHSWTDYGLGRGSSHSLIPKETTAAQASIAVLPQLQGRLHAISFRVPTSIVSASDLSVVLERGTSVKEVNTMFKSLAETQPRVFGFETDQLVSIDYLGFEQTCIVDARRTQVLGGKFVKLVAWYDNEWGYSSRVVDVVRLLGRGK